MLAGMVADVYGTSILDHFKFPILIESNLTTKNEDQKGYFESIMEENRYEIVIWEMIGLNIYRTLNRKAHIVVNYMRLVSVTMFFFN